MNRPGRLFSLLLLFTIAVSSLITVESAAAQSIPKPSVPEFTVQYVDNSYDVSTQQHPVSSTNPYTGEITNSTSVVYGYHVDNRTIVLTITRQPFTEYQSNGQNINLFYDVRFKGHYGQQEWIGLFNPDNSYSPSIEGMTSESTADYTTYSFQIGGSENAFGADINNGGKVDFQVEALIGSIHRDASQALAPWVFDGQESGWSNTQTITVPSASASPSPTVPEFSIFAVFLLFVIPLIATLLIRKPKNKSMI